MKMELLAPAGEWKALIAAIASGADAVYLGLQKFSARAGAVNFTLQELGEGIEVAHLHGVKIYVAMNTLIRDDEIEDAMNLVNEIYHMGADGLIIQDLGFAALVKQNFPALPLHASTQLTIHNYEGALFLKECGVSRVIPARELTRQEISRLTTIPDLEVEVFVHGALCVCYSGQCLLSSMIGGRSGNRGRCAQPCRLAYSLDDKKGHFLSPKDLNLLANLPVLADLGVKALKIEGRLKRPAYVATVVDIYRRALDLVADKNKTWHVPEEWQEALAQIFNRDFTPGYFEGYSGAQMMSFLKPNNRGDFLGRVIATDKKKQRIRLKVEKELRCGDGIEVWVTRGGRQGVEVTRIWRDNKEIDKLAAGEIGEVWFAGQAAPGDRVFKTYDCLLMTEALTKCNADEIRIPLKLKLIAREGEKIVLHVKDDLNHEVTIFSDFIAEKALKYPLTREIIAGQMGRMGGTPYFLAQMEVELCGEVMVPLSLLNELRRRAIAEMTKVRMEGLGFTSTGREKKRDISIPCPDRNVMFTKESRLRLGVRVGDFTALKKAAELQPEVIYFGYETFSPARWTPEELRQGIDFCHQCGVYPVITTPVIMKDHELAEIIESIKKLREKRNFGLRVGNLGLLSRLAKEAEMPIYLDFSLNIFNKHSASSVLAQSNLIRQNALSPELNREQMKGIVEKEGDLWWEIFAQGRLNLMISEYCPYHALKVGKGSKENCPRVCRNNKWELKDDKNYRFPLQMDEFCRLHLLNSVDHCLIGELSFLKTWQAKITLHIDGRYYEPDFLEKVVRFYREGLSKLAENSGSNLGPQVIYGKDSIGKYTKGHFYRGVL